MTSAYVDDNMNRYRVEVSRLELKTYTVWVRAFDEEDAEEQAMFKLNPSKPDTTEVVEQYANQVDYAGV